MKTINIYSKKYGEKKIIIDDEDYEKVSSYCWYLLYANRVFYAIKEHERGKDGKRQKISLHRFLLNDVSKNMDIDHIDNDGLNCQKSNLRVCTHKNNSRNRRRANNSASKYLGVFIKNCKTKFGTYTYWVSGIREYGKSKCTETKSFPHNKQGEIEAAKYYDMIAKKHYGEFANLNFK